MLLTGVPGLMAQTPQPAFEHLSIENGLSHNTVTSILQDSKGLMWFGTSDGLNLYDGYRFTVFKSNIYDSLSISGNRITRIFEDSRGRLWIGTRNGLNLFDRENFNFRRFPLLPVDNQDQNTFVKAIYEDKQQSLWVGSYGSGLFLFDEETGSFTPVALNAGQTVEEKKLDLLVSDISEDSRGNFWIATSRTGLILFNRNTWESEFRPFTNEEPVRNSFVKTIFEDKDGELWVCTEQYGLYRIEPGSWKITHYLYQPEKNSLSNNIVKDVLQDRSGRLWFATDGGGINIFDKQTGKFSHYTFDIGERSSLSSNAVYTFYKDPNDIIWIGTFGGGINIMDPNKKPFLHFTQEENNPQSLSHPAVLSFGEDKDGIIWIGTDGGGLNRFDPERRQFKPFKHEPSDNSSLSSNAVTSIHIDSRNRVWVGTFAGGLNLFDPGSGKFTRYRNNPDNPESIINDNVWVIEELDEERLLVGTLAGLDVFNPVTSRFSHHLITSESEKTVNNRILDLMVVSEREIWIGSNGLWKLNLESGVMKPVPLIIGKDTLSWNFDVREIFMDSRDQVWIGTEGGGLLKYQPDQESFLLFTITEGLPNNAIHEIQEDEEGYLWISTNGGLTRLDTETGVFRNYDASDGLQSSQFSYSASLYTRDGRMLFGGVNGFNIFVPGDIKDNPFQPPVLFTDFRLFNREVELNTESSPLKAHISMTSEITLKHNQSVISFEFAALNYTSTGKNQYEFIMEGFEDEWNRVGNQRTATYTNLDPGEYVFRVRASNNDGVWNTEGAALNLTVLPPFWETKFAFVLYGIVILLMLFSYRQYSINRAHMKNEIRIKELEKKQIENVNQMKMQFFTNISHEFRTPLTLILAPLQKLASRDDLDEQVTRLHSIMYRNANRLLRLINQLMDLRKIEKGSMDLRVSENDIVSYVKDIMMAFNNQASDKTILYSFESDLSYLKIWFDADKLDKIIYNLLSNAFKFTPEGGKITLRIRVKSPEDVLRMGRKTFRRKTSDLPENLSNGYVEITLKDTGPGIPPEKLDKIFDRFYQIPLKESYRQQGTGIGLSLAKDLAILHQGDLTASSVPGKGSKFKVYLPLDPGCYTPEQKDETIRPLQAEHSDIQVVIDEKYQEINEHPEFETGEPETRKSSILIVEDNSDVRNFIKISLEPIYRILQAENGREGMEIAFREIPDLIISDIMMPEMDGIEMARHIHADKRTSHIPLIFLTAKTNETSRIEGLETGVEDYIPKPFNPRELALKVKNIINRRKMLAENLRQRLILEPSIPEIESSDERFTRQAMEIVENHISDSEFDVQEFVREMGMSRSVLYRKLRSVTNQSANEFINSIRLKRAAQLLASNSFNVSEVSYMVGFNDPQYFSKCFRKQYNLTPSQYAAENKVPD